MSKNLKRFLNSDILLIWCVQKLIFVFKHEVILMKSNNIDNAQMSLFEIIPGMKEEKVSDDIISVTKVKFISQENTTYEDLFIGYNELRVITFSYALSFIEKIMHFFDRGEVILGFEQLVNKNVAALIANQQFSINEICKNSYLQKRIIDNEFKFYVLNDLVSHQKVYLLKADDGRVRTITGSANFSQRAWTGDQIETVTVCDDYECYKVYQKQYETLQQFSTDEIAKNAVPISEDGDNAEELPFFKRIEKENAVLIHDINSCEEKEYAFHAEKLNKDWEERLKAVKLKSAKEGKILLEVKHIRNMLTGIKKDIQIKRKRERINPQFVLDYVNHSAVYNQKEFFLTPDPDDVKSDLLNIYEYMSGFDLFTKDTVRLKTLYWKVLNYMFLSPFIAKLRYEGNLFDYEDRFFPMYMLIYGDSDAGKTGFINLTRQLMFGEKMNPLTQDYFSSKPMTSLKTDVKGCPILIDELTPTYWKYAKDIVKMDSMLIKEKITNHPTFVLLSNDINNVAPELSKRIIVINLDNRLDRTTAAYNGKKINSIIKNIGNSLYCEYLRRMFEGVDNLIEELQEHDNKDKKDWIPDIFTLSSGILQDIMIESGTEVPAEFRVFTWFDYMGDAVISEKADGIIRDEFTHNSKIFTENESRNELEIDFSCYDTNESKKKLRILHDELPADVECKIIGTKAVLKLNVIREHTGLTFKTKKGFLWFKR